MKMHSNPYFKSGAPGFGLSNKGMQRITNLKFQQGNRQKQGQMTQDLEMIIQNQLNHQQMILKLGEDLYSLLDNKQRNLLSIKSRNLSLGPDLTTSEDSTDTTQIRREMITTHDPRLESVKSTDGETGLAVMQKSQQNPEGNYDRQLILNLLDPIVKRFRDDTQAIVNITSSALRVSIDDQVKRRIDTWITNPGCEAVWILGPHDVSHPSQNTLTAVCLIALSSRHDVPSLSYFCSLRTLSSLGSRLTHKEILLDMIKSFIVQLLLRCPEHITTELDLSSSRLSMLMEPDVDIGMALELFFDVRTLAPRYMHCVIEAVQELEDRGDAQHTRQLQRALREIVKPPALWSSRNSGDPGREVKEMDAPEPQRTRESELERAMKVCFTSDGYVDALAELASRDEVEKVEYAEEAGQFGAEESSDLMDG